MHNRCGDSRRITREKKTFFRLRSSRMRGIIILVGTKFIITRVSNFFSYILIFTTVPYKKKSSLTSFLLVWDDFNLFPRFLWWCGWLCESHFDHRRRRRRRLSFTGLVAVARRFGQQGDASLLLAASDHFCCTFSIAFSLPTFGLSIERVVSPMVWLVAHT